MRQLKSARSKLQAFKLKRANLARAKKLWEKGRFGPNTLGAAQRLPRVMQTGGHTLRQSTANALNDYFGVNLHKREWGRAFEGLKEYNGIANDDHTCKILDNGNVQNIAGQIIDNLFDYLE